ncbi:hypothetical protein K469DRAFT_691838 [Zopfia rhizophila CBS 207.26]|uniref:Macro domain-containing protein n=1 Tax=Zopfia rhizophila CBS 207.26 TaxID=1314779 RepID=A0A6A6DU55_9PEZI|nr:hypothetical protein K469DRAFT_691838 [Zopfia rhizophila CBS 207.26]
MSTSTIRLGAAGCFRAFQSLFATLRKSDSAFKQPIDSEALEDEFGRFRVWSGNLGALQRGHSSLDYRLRDSPLLQSNTLKLLEELNNNLSEAIAVVSGNRLPYEQQPRSEGSETDDDDDFFSEDEYDDSEASAPKTELEQRFRDIIDIVDNLYKLSMRIRSPTLRSRALKATAYQPKDPETGVDILQQYAHYDLQHTKELLRYLRNTNVGNASEGGNFLIERLSKAITLRRRQFKYWRRHRDKMGASTVLEEVAEEPVAKKERPEVPQRHHTLEVHPENPVVVAKKEAASEKAPTILSGTEATQHHKSLDEIVDSQSVTSYTTTTRDLTGRGIELPSPPKAADGEKDFECPFCFTICPSRYGKMRPWRTHLLQDLQPYVCTYEGCHSEQLFRSRREWSEHEAGHRQVWRCPEHPNAVYRSKSGLEEHLRGEHSDNFPDHQLASIIKVGETSAIDLRQKCPICFAKADMEGGLQNHLANHLERIASFSLPKDIDTMDDKSDGGSSAASLGSSQDLSTISFDSNSISGQEDDISPEKPGQTPFPLPGEQYSANVNGDVDAHKGEGLSAELLGYIPDSSRRRLDILMSSQNPSAAEFPGTTDSVDSEELEAHLANVDVSELYQGGPDARMEVLRNYLLSLQGSQSVRLLRRSGWWRGYANFVDAAAAAQALEHFDNAHFPEVRIRQGVRNKTSLKFSLPLSGNLQSSLTTQVLPTAEKEDSVSSMSLEYDRDPRTEEVPVLSLQELKPFTLHSLYKSRKLLQRDQSYAPNDEYNEMLCLIFYDVTKIRVDSIVNSANRAMKITRTSDTLNYYVHKAAGPGLKRECKTFGSAKVGDIRVSSGYDLPCEYVIHAVRPQYTGSKSMGSHNQLASCYRESLKAAMNLGFKSIAFPTLAAGGCGFPSRMAARIALQEVREFLDVYKGHGFRNIVFCVYTGVDERAYSDFLPVYFPPTHGDIEAAAQFEPELNQSRDYAAFAAELSDLYPLLENVAHELVFFSQNINDFPSEIITELAAIASGLRSLKNCFQSSRGSITNLNSRTTADFDLICCVLQSVCGGITEILEQTKYTKNFGQPTHRTIWDDYNTHMKRSQGLDLQALLELCQNFVQSLDDILTRNGIEPPEIGIVRDELAKYRLKQTGQGEKQKRDVFDEVMFTRQFHSQTISPKRTDTIKVHQIPSLAHLYRLGELEPRSTNAIPDSKINHCVCLLREDITRLEVEVIVNSTDMGFSGKSALFNSEVHQGMGTLDRTIYKKGGLSLQEECATFGVLKEGDLRVTGGYLLPQNHVIHTIPPERYGKDAKGVLRKCYKEALYTAASLKASSIAFPAIGTGMLGFPKRECASVAMEEVKRFLETYPNPMGKIVFCVFGENDEFIYKSLLPVYFPPVEPADINVNKAFPSSSSLSSSSIELKQEASSSTESAKPPRRTLFSSIGEAFRNVRFGKQPVTQTSRPLNAAEQQCLSYFESHARNCPTCNNIARVYAERRSLCADGYDHAQGVLQYLYMEADQNVYSTNLEGGRRVQVEIPNDMYPVSWNLLTFTERSFRDPSRGRPFVSPNQPYGVDGDEPEADEPSPPGAAIYNAEVTIPRKPEPEKAIVSVFAWSNQAKSWESLHPFECSIEIYPGKVEVYEQDHRPEGQVPLLCLELTPLVPLEKEMSTDLTVRAKTLPESRVKTGNYIKFRCRSPAECEMLFQRLKQSRNQNSTYLAHQSAQDSSTKAEEKEDHVPGASALDLPAVPSHDPSTRSPAKSALTAQLQAAGLASSASLTTPTTAHQSAERDSRGEMPAEQFSQQQPTAPNQPVNPDRSAYMDLSISGLSSVNIEDYYSYLDLASTDSQSSKLTRKAQESRPSLTRSMSLDTGTGELSETTTILPVHQRQKGDKAEGEAKEQDEEDEDDGIRHPRPTTPEVGEQSIPANARWTKIDRRLVNAQALEEAGERFEEREGAVIVLRVVPRENIMRLAERTREIRRGKKEGDG